MNPYYDAPGMQLYQGDCRVVMVEMAEASADAIVTDPPYGIGFMGKAWDVPRIEHQYATKGLAAFGSWTESWARTAVRVLKPGGHILVCGSPRTYHRMVCGLEDAGFEIRDCLMWIFGSGFPKSLDVAKALDKVDGHWRGRASGVVGDNGAMAGPNYGRTPKGSPITEAAAAWEGWGTALKPAYEPIVLARKPLAGTVAANVTAHGVGGLNIDGCRIGSDDTRRLKSGGANDFPHEDDQWAPRSVEVGSEHGRWPSNVLLDEEAARLLDAQAPAAGAFAPVRGTEPTADGLSGPVYGTAKGRIAAPFYGDAGGASRFFYIAKTSKAEREYGLDDLDPARRTDAETRDAEAPGSNNPRLRTNERRNDHPTVKPVDLMRWLCRLVTPPGGLVLDPFVGSGSTGMAALDEGFRFIGIDLEERYLEIAKRRIARRAVLEPVPQRADDPQGALL